MALTKVGGGVLRQPIDVGIITATSVNASGVITATTFDGNVTGNITGNVTGNLTGNVTGNLTGNVTGNVTGTATTATNAQGLTGSPSITVTNITATGNVSVGGTLTYEDVTNVDSVGLITARGGISVTGGELNIETTGAIGLPTGTNAQRPSPPQAGQIRYNNENQQFEGYSTAWGGFGGASGSSGNAVFYENDTNVTASYSITSGKNAMSAGPITLNANIIVTIPAGSVWTVV
tara:strand:+ start:475 stop:1176 length:702 start_codon:yes stop_codon:yes gene_type:complete